MNSSDEPAVKVRGFEVKCHGDGQIWEVIVTTSHHKGRGQADHRHKIVFTIENGAEAVLKTDRTYADSDHELHLHNSLPAVFAAERAVGECLDAVANVIGLIERSEEFAEQFTLEPPREDRQR
jgi:hypothetical protein